MTVPDRLHRSNEHTDYTDEYLVGTWGAFGLAYRKGELPAPKQFGAWLRYVLAATFGRSRPPL